MKKVKRLTAKQFDSGAKFAPSFREAETAKAFENELTAFLDALKAKLPPDVYRDVLEVAIGDTTKGVPMKEFNVAKAISLMSEMGHDWAVRRAGPMRAPVSEAEVVADVKKSLFAVVRDRAQRTVEPDIASLEGHEGPVGEAASLLRGTTFKRGPDACFVDV